MQIKHVRMVHMPVIGPMISTNITEAEACAMRNNVFMRPGHVVCEGIQNGHRIVDDNGETLLTAVFEDSDKPLASGDGEGAK